MSIALRDTRFLRALSSPLAPLAGMQIGFHFYTLAVFFGLLNQEPDP